MLAVRVEERPDVDAIRVDLDERKMTLPVLSGYLCVSEHRHQQAAEQPVLIGDFRGPGRT